MGWKASLVAAPDWTADMDSLMAGHVDTGKRTDFHSVPMELASGEIAVGRLSSGAYAAVAHAGGDQMASLGIMASLEGASGEFHLQSTVSFYAYRIYNRSGIQEDRTTESEENGLIGEDDALSLLDEEDGLAAPELSEDWLLEKFNALLGEKDWGWSDKLEMAIYSPAISPLRPSLDEM